MAASTDRESSKQQVYAFLVGHGLLVLGYIFFTVGFATDHWLTTPDGRRYGLWEYCEDDLCLETSSGFSSWMLASRAMQTLALISYMGGVLLALFLHCATTTSLKSPSSSCHFPRALEISTGVGCVFCLIGVSVYGARGDTVGTLKYSYALTVLSLFLSAIGTVMVAATRNNVTSNSTSVAPQTSIQVSQSQGGASYPYGRGQHNAELPNPGYGFRQDTYPYGGNPDPVSSNNPRQLPYPLQPEGSGGFGTVPMPEPSPGYGRPHGHSQPQGRLPPIAEVSASAPPLPPPEDGNQPPSYLEAIGGARP